MNRFRVENNILYMDDKVLDKPTVYLDDLGVVFMLGEYEDVVRRYDHDIAKYREAGLKDIAESLRLITYITNTPERKEIVSVLFNWMDQCSGLGKNLLSILESKEKTTEKVKKLKEVEY